MIDSSGLAPSGEPGKSPANWADLVSLLELKDVCAAYGRAPRRGRRRGKGSARPSQPGGPLMTVRHASLVIQRGESVGLVGESGSGKTTLGNCIAGLMPLAAGEIRYED